MKRTILREKKRKAIGYVIAFILLIASIQVVLSNVTYRQHMISGIEKDITNISSLVEFSMKKDRDRYRNIVLSTLKLHHKFVEHVEAKNIDEVEKIAELLISDLKNEYSYFQQLNIFDKSGQIIFGQSEESYKLGSNGKDGIEFGQFIIDADEYRSFLTLYGDGEAVGGIEVVFNLVEIMKDLKSEIKHLSIDSSKIDFSGIMLDKNLVNDSLKSMFNHQESDEFTIFGISKLLSQIISNNSIQLSKLHSQLHKVDSIQIDKSGKSYTLFQNPIFIDKSGVTKASLLFILDTTDERNEYIMYNMRLLALMLLLIIIVYILSELSWRYFLAEIESSLLHLDRAVTENRELESLFDSGEVAVVRIDNSEELKISFISNSIKDITGFSKNDLKNIKDFFVEESTFTNFRTKLYKSSLKRERVIFEKIAFRGRDNSVVKVDIHAIVATGLSEKEFSIMLAIYDNSYKHILEHKIDILKSRFRFLLSSIDQDFWEIDIQKRKFYTSIPRDHFSREQMDIYRTIFKKVSSEDIDKFEFIYDDKDRFYEHTIREILKESEFDEFQFQIDKPNQKAKRDSDIIKIDIIGKSVIHNKSVVKVFGVSSENLSVNMIEDGNIKINALQNLMSRDEMEKTLLREVARSRRYRNPLSLIFFDIDDFEGLEQLEGREEAEEILSQLISQFELLKRATDIIGRWSKSEFVFIAFETDLESAKIFAEKLRERAERTLFKNGVKVTCSFGVEEFNLRYDKNLFIQKTHKALVSARNSGGNSVYNYEKESE